jgi:AcrR family transcriptional regulator
MERKDSVAKAAKSRERILIAAERVIAEHGSAAPLRDIAIAAGQRNNSAVQYYFTDRDGLIAAVVGFRLASLEARRFELLATIEAEGRADDPAELVAVLAQPMFEVPRRDGATHYARFLEQVRSHPAVRDLGTHQAEHYASVRIVLARLGRAVAHLPAPLRVMRVEAMTTTLFALLADHERALETGALEARNEALARADILQMLVAVLFAPAPPRRAR